MKVLTIILVGLALGVSAALASPGRLYTSLLTTAYPDSQLPSGYFSAKVSLLNASSRARGYHVIGEVSVSVTGPDVGDEIFYIVFPNAADARADFKGAATLSGVHVVGKVPGYRIPSEWLTGSVTGQNAFGKTVTNGFTGMDVQEGSVLVAASTFSSDSTDSGNVPATLALLKSGIRHLQRIEARLSKHG